MIGCILAHQGEPTAKSCFFPDSLTRIICKKQSLLQAGHQLECGFSSPHTAHIPMLGTIIMAAWPPSILQAWLPSLALWPHHSSPNSCMQLCVQISLGACRGLSAHHTADVYAGLAAPTHYTVLCTYQLGEGVLLSQPKSWTCCQLHSSGFSHSWCGMAPNLQMQHPYRASQAQRNASIE